MIVSQSYGTVIDSINIGNIKYELYHEGQMSDVFSSQNLVSSPNNIFYIGNRWIHHLYIDYTTNLYTGTANRRKGKVGGSSTTWKIQNKVSNVSLPKSSNSTPEEIYSIGTTNYQDCSVLIRLATDGQIWFERLGGTDIPASQSIQIKGSLIWLASN